MLSSWELRLNAWGYQPLFCSVEKKYRLKQLEDILKGKTNVIVGPSGVGKSSLINAIRENPSGVHVRDCGSENLLENVSTQLRSMLHYYSFLQFNQSISVLWYLTFFDLYYVLNNII